MNRIYFIDDVLDGEFEYQTDREVLFNNRKHILKLCNDGYLFDEEVLNRAGIESKPNINLGVNTIHISSSNPSIEDIINNRINGETDLINFKKYINNKHCPDSLSEEDELGYNIEKYFENESKYDF